ncbi:MAG: hypothetical protein AAGJ18_31040, partial [Bacteroidota bacterium]
MKRDSTQFQPSYVSFGSVSKAIAPSITYSIPQIFLFGFLVIYLLLLSNQLVAQTAVTNISTYYIDINDNSNDYITTGSPVSGSSFSSSTNYTIQHTTTTTVNNDLLLNGFTSGGNFFDFQFLADTVVFKRVDNPKATGERQIIQLAIESKSGNTYKLEPSYVPSEAAALNSLTINRGADNVFA